MNVEFAELIQRRLSGLLTEDEVAAFEASLAAHAELRRLYLDFVNLDVALASKAASDDVARELIAAPASVRGSRWLKWPAIAAAIGGVLIGLSAASLVYGIVAQRQQVTSQTLLTEGFEDEAMPRDRGLPRRAGVWSGDLLGPQGGAGGVAPAEGRHMAVLPPVEKRKFSYASRFLDVSALPAGSPGRSRQIEVTARFHSAASDDSAGELDRFQIRLAAFAEDIPAARAIWIEGKLDELALLHVAKTVRPQPENRGWTTVRSAIDVPAGARYVLISLAAGVADEEATKTEHFLDDVQVRLITRDASRQSVNPK